MLGSNPNPPAVTIVLGAFGATFNLSTPNLSALAGGGWTPFTFHVSFEYPVLEFSVNVNNRHSWYRTQVDYVSITPTSAG
jgi:hypothetical protein